MSLEWALAHVFKRALAWRCGEPAAAVARKVGAALAQVGLEGFDARRPSQLSGGQNGGLWPRGGLFAFSTSSRPARAAPGRRPGASR